MANKKYYITYKNVDKNGKVSVGDATYNDTIEAESETNAIAKLREKRKSICEIQVMSVTIK